MHCPNCHAEAIAEDISCHHCGADLVKTSTSIIPVQRNLPALFTRSPLPRRVAAGVGALALGIGIELLRRNIVSRGYSRRTLPVGAGLKDLLFSRSDKVKLPKGYEIHETVMYVTRIIRRQN